MRVQLGRERGVRLINEGRETARLQIIELTKRIQEREAKDPVRAAFERRVNDQFNKQAKYICNWLERTIKRSTFCRNFANSWNNFCNRIIAGLTVLICWHSWKINQYMKKNERDSVNRKVDEGLEQVSIKKWFFDGTDEVEIAATCTS